MTLLSAFFVGEDTMIVEFGSLVVGDKFTSILQPIHVYEKIDVCGCSETKKGIVRNFKDEEKVNTSLLIFTNDDYFD